MSTKDQQPHYHVLDFTDHKIIDVESEEAAARAVHELHQLGHDVYCILKNRFNFALFSATDLMVKQKNPQDGRQIIIPSAIQH